MADGRCRLAGDATVGLRLSLIHILPKKVVKALDILSDVAVMVLGVIMATPASGTGKYIQKRLSQGMET